MLKIYNNLLTEFKRGQLGYSVIGILGQSCIGSIAVMLLLMSNMSTLTQMVLTFLVTAFCMAYNGVVLAQLAPKTIFNLLILSVGFSACIIVALIF